jgi:hypothetical protein
VDVIIETRDVPEAVKVCADIIVQGWDKQVYCQLETSRRLMDTWKTRGSSMVVREFEDDGEDIDCDCFRAFSPIKPYRVPTEKLSGFSGRVEMCYQSQSGGFQEEVQKNPGWRLPSTHIRW